MSNIKRYTIYECYEGRGYEIHEDENGYYMVSRDVLPIIEALRAENDRLRDELKEAHDQYDDLKDLVRIKTTEVINA